MKVNHGVDDGQMNGGAVLLLELGDDNVTL